MACSGSADNTSGDAPASTDSAMSQASDDDIADNDLSNSTATEPVTTDTTLINIDSEGTGTLSRVNQFGSQTITHSGTSTYSDNTVSWDASRYAYDGDYRHHGNVINTVTVVDENTRTVWRVVEETTNTRFITKGPDVITSDTSEYFARNLSNYLCDFVEF